MSTVAQRIELGPFFSSGALQGGAQLYHYAAGTTTLKNIWSDQGETVTLPQPFIADANGIFNFFADGLYKLVIMDPTGSTVLYTLDNWQMLDSSAGLDFSEGAAIPSASTVVLGAQVWTHITGSTNINAFSGTIPFFWAVFDGNLTLVNSSNLLIPGNASLAVQVGDTAFFLNEGSGVWRLSGFARMAGVQDGRTNTVSAAQTVRATTSGSPSAGIGTAILLQGQATAETPSDFAQIQAVASNVGAGSVATYVELLMRVAGAALSAAYRFVATTAFRAIFTHSNTADRTYALPDATTSIVATDVTQTLTNKTINGANNTISNINTAALKTATGAASGSLNNGAGPGSVDITMNDYAFAPMVYAQSPLDARGRSGGDLGTTQGAIAIVDPNAGDPTNYSYVVRWRYVTASDNPDVWVVPDATGQIVACWWSDDALESEHPPIAAQGLSPIRISAQDLQRLTIPQAAVNQASALIAEKGLKTKHLPFRALSAHVGDDAPSEWFLHNCKIDEHGKLAELTAQEKADRLKLKGTR